ncbi:MAG: Smr/MutS family protein [Candidatus Aquirickettsiella sp.]
MNKSVPPDKEDLAFFREAMSDVKRTQSLRVRTKLKKIISVVDKEKLINLKDEKQLISIALSDPAELNVGSEDRLFFNRPGLQSKRIKQLVRGDIRQSDYLDLHKMTVEQARRAVLDFLLHSRAHNYICVRIIHGKGKLNQSGAKLKNHVNCWLRQISWVLAFSSAQLRDGGAGALYVLLRRIR